MVNPLSTTTAKYDHEGVGTVHTGTKRISATVQKRVKHSTTTSISTTLFLFLTAVSTATILASPSGSLMGMVERAHAAPICNITSVMTESKVRSLTERGLVITILNATLNATVPSNYKALLGFTSASGLLQVQSMAFISDVLPIRIQINILQDLTYDIYQNDLVTFSLPAEFFDPTTSGGVGCPSNPLSLNVSASPGTINLDTLPLAITEVDINSQGSSFPLVLSFDNFISSNLNLSVSDPNVGGLAVSFVLGTGTGAIPTQSNTITVNIQKNDTFNILSTESIILEISFSSTVTQSGIVPVIGDEIFGLTSISITIIGSQPFVNVEYPGGNSGVTAESMWDGTATVTLNLLGDYWIDNQTFWNNQAQSTTTGNGPLFDVSRPIQPNGYSLLLQTNLWPTATFSGRKLTLKFPARYGFALSSSPVETVDIYWLSRIINETNTCDANTCTAPCLCGTFRILRADSNNIRATVSSQAITGTLWESDVRKTGLYITISLKYDIYTTSATRAITVRRIFTVNDYLSLTDMALTVSNYTTELQIFIPPQLEYNIAVNDKITIELLSQLLAAQVVPGGSTTQLTIYAVPTPQTYLDRYVLTEDDIRAKENTLVVQLQYDEFCFGNSWDPDYAQKLTLFISQVTSSGGLARFSIAAFTKTNLTLRIDKDVNYDISATSIIKISIPREVMCSLEYPNAIPDAVSPDPYYLLSMPIRSTAGKLYATLPTVTEQFPRTTSLFFNVELSGETFLTSILRPSFNVESADPQRGFLSSIASSCEGLRDNNNRSKGNITCSFNSSYDVSVTENVTVYFNSDMVAGKLLASTVNVVPLVVTPLIGNLTVDPNNTNRVFYLNEGDVVSGGFSFTVRLLWERFDMATLAASIADSIVITSSSQAQGIISSGSSMFTSVAFSTDIWNEVVVVTLQPCPLYDITVEEVFEITFKASSVAGLYAPYDNKITFHVQPSPGRLEAFGTAVRATARQVLEDALVMNLQLYNDIWLSTAPYRSSELCPLGPCTVVVTGNGRILQILFERNPDFFIYAETTFNLTIRAEYLSSNTVPSGVPNITIVTSAGRLTWSGPSNVVEDVVREGTMEPIYLSVDGDLLGELDTVRTSLISSVSCEGSSDKFSFCSRAAVLFSGIGMSILAGRRRLTIQLQSDGLFDVYKTETVTLRLSSTALISRLNPWTNESFVFTVQPTAGQYFLSGFVEAPSERDISGVTQATLRMVLTLYGERWLSNTSAIITNLLQTFTTDAALRESHGFATYKSVIFSPGGAVLSETGRVVTLQFLPAPLYNIFADETITIAVGGNAILSGLAPVLSSKTNKFTIRAAGGLITLTPSIVTQQVIQTTGVNLTLVVDGDQWRTDVVQDSVAILEAIRLESSPQEEPNGFAVYLDIAVADIRSRGSAINGSILMLTLLPIPKYSLLNEEVLTLKLTTDWTTSGLELLPDSFSMTILPFYDYVECVLWFAPYLTSSTTSSTTTPTAVNGTFAPTTNTTTEVAVTANASTGFNMGTFSLRSWVEAVASMLSVTPSQIQVSYIGEEYLLPESARDDYARIQFRVLGAEGASAPYNNEIANTFVSTDSTYLRTSFSVIKAFYNSTPPTNAFWISLQPAPEEKSWLELIPVNTTMIFIFSFIIVVVIAVLLFVLWWKSRSRAGGVARAKERDRVFEKAADDEELLDVHSTYSGQRKAEVRLEVGADDGGGYSPPRGTNKNGAGGDTSPRSRGGGIVSSSPTYNNNKSSKIQRDYDLPLDLYIGQQASRSMASPTRGGGASSGYGAGGVGSASHMIQEAALDEIDEEFAHLRLDEEAEEDLLARYPKSAALDDVYLPTKARRMGRSVFQPDVEEDEEEELSGLQSKYGVKKKPEMRFADL